MKFIILLIAFGIANGSDWNGRCNFQETVNITGGYKDDKGNYLHNGIIYSPDTFGSINFTINRFNERIPTSPHVRGCICLYKPCIRFCCEEEGCIRDKSFELTTVEGSTVQIDLDEGRFGLLLTRPACKEMYKLDPLDYDDDVWNFINNGSLELGGEVFDVKNYCFKQTEDENTSLVTTDAFLCHNPPVDQRLKWYPYGMMFSIPFLIITFCIYGFIPELRNLHGKCLMCYIFGLTLLYICLTCIQLDHFFTFFLINSFPCLFIGYLTFFSILLCFLWLNVMSLDIWRTYRHGIAAKSQGKERKTFLIYCLYGFGVPSIFTLIFFLIDFTQFLSHHFQPKVGTRRCWIEDSRLIEAIYVYIPISIIVLINIALFFLTANKIRQVKSIDVNGGQSTRANAAKYRYNVYLQLFILMGVFWCMESISWIFDNSSFVFYITDFINCIQGFLIFLICVMKKRTRKLVIEKICRRSGGSVVDSGYNDSSVKTIEMQ